MENSNFLLRGVIWHILLEMELKSKYRLRFSRHISNKPIVHAWDTLQGNLLNVRDMINLQAFENLKKIDLSFNQLESLPPANVFAGLQSLQFLYLHNNNISKWQDLQSLVSLPEIMHITNVLVFLLMSCFAKVGRGSLQPIYFSDY